MDLFFGQTSWSFSERSSGLFRGIQCHPVNESARHVNKRFILHKHDVSRSKNHTAVQNLFELKGFFSHLLKYFLVSQSKIKKSHAGNCYLPRENCFYLILLFPKLVFLHLQFQNNSNLLLFTHCYSIIVFMHNK